MAALGDGPVSGPDLAEELGLSRAAVWKHVEALRESGFEIETEGGYAITGIPEFGGEAVMYECAAPFAIEYHGTIESTNDRARELATGGERGVVVLADEQTCGRGRLGRTWTGPSGGIYLSVVLRPTLAPVETPVLTLAAAVAVTRAAHEEGVDAVIKWPNDVLVRSSGRAHRTALDGTIPTHRKLAGVLTEMEGEADRVSWVVVGVGVNANVPCDDLPEGSTSLLEEVGGPIVRRSFVGRMLEEFDDVRNDPEGIVDAWTEHAITIGRRVRIETGERTIVGEAIDVEVPGALVVDTGDEQVRVHAGECEHLRPQ